MVMEGDLTWGGEHRIQYDVLQNCTPETYIILFTPINSMKQKKNQMPMLVCKDFWDQELTNQMQPYYVT